MPGKISAIISLTLVSMVLNGPNIQDQSNLSGIPQSVLTITQLLMYHCSIRRREASSLSMPKHSQERETPLPIFLGTLIHSKTRKRELVDYMFELGLSISYDRVLEISTLLGNRICNLYNSQGVVCPLASHHHAQVSFLFYIPFSWLKAHCQWSNPIHPEKQQLSINNVPYHKLHW